jgi:membrane associated rhomboid family serine protease
MGKFLAGLKTLIVYFFAAGIIGAIFNIILAPYGEHVSLLGSLAGIIIAVAIYAYRRKSGKIAKKEQGNGTITKEQ